MITHYFNSSYVWGLGQIDRTIQIPKWIELVSLLREGLGFEYIGDIASIRRNVSEHLEKYFSDRARDHLKDLSPTWHFLRAPNDKVWAIGYLPEEIQMKLQEAVPVGGKTFIDDDNPFPVRDVERAVSFFGIHARDLGREPLSVRLEGLRLVILGVEPAYELYFQLFQDVNAPVRLWDSQQGSPADGLLPATETSR